MSLPLRWLICLLMGILVMSVVLAPFNNLIETCAGVAAYTGFMIVLAVTGLFK